MKDKLKRDGAACHVLWYACGLISSLILLLSSNGQVLAQNHLLLSEITLQPSQAEFIEIYNPTNTSIALDNYYLADNQNYPYVTGVLPSLDLGDVVARFPSGASVNSNDVVIIAMNGNEFEIYYGLKADFEIISADAATPDMVIIGQNTPTLSNDGEGLVLFQWNGIDSTVKDVDLMNAGIPTSSSEILDKSSIPGYLPDAHTMPYQGHTGPAGSGFSTKRILLEGPYEISAGGNGITGHDETSEDISVTWDEVYTSPTPGFADVLTNVSERSGEKATRLMVYPNPCSSEIHVIAQTMDDEYTIRIRDLKGAVLKEFCTANAYVHVIDMSGFDDGFYLISFQSKKESIVQKLVVCH